MDAVHLFLSTFRLIRDSYALNAGEYEILITQTSTYVVYHDNYTHSHMTHCLNQFPSTCHDNKKTHCNN